MPKDKPEIRFAGYTDAWEKRNVTEVAKVSIGLVTTMTAHYTDRGTLLIRNSDIKSGRFDFDENPIYLTSEFADQNQNRKLVLGDVVTVHTGDIGTSAVISHSEDGAIGFATINSRPNGSLLNSEYFATFLNTQGHKNFAFRMATGDGRLNYNLKDFNKLYVPTPTVNEQKQIGTFFKLLDNLIAVNQRKVDLLKELKKGFLQKMFPKNGEDKPEIRFGGYTDAWEKRKLGEITNISTGKLDANAMVDNGKYDFYTSGIKKYKINTPSFEGPAITIAGNGATVGYMHLADNKFNAYQRTYVLQNFLADRNFLFSEIGNKLPKKINQEARNGNIPYIVMDMLTELKLTLPISDTEQQMIGIFLKQLDNLITVNQRRVDLLKQEKKALLQKMFV